MQRFEHQENVSPRSVEEMTSDSQQNPFLVKCPVVRARSAPNFKERPRLMIAFQTKRIGAAVAYKRIQGGVQPDVSVRITSNFIWEMLSLELRPYGCTENIKRLPFHVEEEYGSKVWTRRCESCLVQPWQHKQYTTVRIQFCKGYYGMRLQFIARVGKHTACTKIPIVVVKAGICKTRSLQNVPSVPQMRGKRRRGGEFREQLSDDSADSADISPVETAPSDDHVLSTCTLPVRGNPRRRKPDHQHPLQRACNLGEHSADQPNMKVTQSGTRRSNELDYALAEQLCSLQTLVRNSYK